MFTETEEIKKININPLEAPDAQKDSDKYKIYQALLIALRDHPESITEIITPVKEGQVTKEVVLPENSIKLKKKDVKKNSIVANVYTAECCYQFIYDNYLVQVTLTHPIKKMENGYFAIISEQIGKGGQGEVKLAQVQHLDDKNQNEITCSKDPYVVKTIKSLTKDDELGIDKLVASEGNNEVEIGNSYAQINHRTKGGVLRTKLLGNGEISAYRQDVLMPKIDGVTLKEKLQKLSLVACFELMDKLLDELDVFYTHTEVYAHGDFKPGNIIINENLQPKLIDFTNIKKIDDQKDQFWHASPKYAVSLDVSVPNRPHMDYYAFGVMFIELSLQKFVEKNPELQNKPEYQAIMASFDNNEYIKEDSFKLYKTFALKYDLHQQNDPIWVFLAVLQKKCQSVDERNAIHQQAKEALAKIILREKEAEKEAEKKFLTAVQKESKKLKQAYAEEFQQEIIGIGVGVFGDKKVIPVNDAENYVIKAPIALAKPETCQE